MSSRAEAGAVGAGRSSTWALSRSAAVEDANEAAAFVSRELRRALVERLARLSSEDASSRQRTDYGWEHADASTGSSLLGSRQEKSEPQQISASVVSAQVRRRFS